MVTYLSSVKRFMQFDHEKKLAMS